MASRLTRWAVGSALGLVAVGVATLPPGPSILYSTIDWDPQAGPPGPNPNGIVQANEGALGVARDRLRVALRRQSLLPLIPKAAAVPVVIRFEDDQAVKDVAMTAVAESLWRAIPRAADAPRVLLVEGDRAVAMRRDIWKDLPPDVCVAAFEGSRGPQTRTIRRGAGGCALATRFGPPGAPVRAWLDSVGPVAFSDAVLPPPGRELVHTLSLLGDMDSWRISGDYYWSPSREQQACAGGRPDQCLEGLGFHGAGVRRIDPPWQRYGRYGGAALLPAALLADLGPERFGQLWRGNDPVPVAYRRLTGRPFDRWAMTYVQNAVGRFDKENGLTALGWLGSAFWIGLVLFWFAVRVERRSAT